METQERKFRTDGGTDGESTVYNFPAKSIQDLPVRVRKITTTDEGKLQLTMEGEAMDNEDLEKVRDLLMIQQGDALVDIRMRQGELPL